MDRTKIDECFSVLGLTRSASFEEIRESYKDLVNVWHPDRFANHPRRKAKAEAKLKEINDAYDSLKIHFGKSDHGIELNEEVIIWKAKPTTPTNDAESDRVLQRRNDRIRLIFFLGAVCLIIGVVYLVKTRRPAGSEPPASATINTLSSQSSPTPEQNSATSANSPINLEAGLVPVETPTPKPAPTASPNDDDLFDSPSPSPSIPTYDEWRARENEKPTPTPQPTPRIERVVSASDQLAISYRKREDIRRYRFQLENIARIKGSFSARGGGVTVRIFAGTSTVYVSGYNVSADSIDVALYPGVYELEVALVGTDFAVVSFSVNASAHYNPE